jgi:hypothetical protein
MTLHVWRAVIAKMECEVQERLGEVPPGQIPKPVRYGHARRRRMRSRTYRMGPGAAE